jgi:hypothetical protein
MELMVILHEVLTGSKPVGMNLCPVMCRRCHVLRFNISAFGLVEYREAFVNCTLKEYGGAYCVVLMVSMLGGRAARNRPSGMKAVSMFSTFFHILVFSL